jgi:hypothetical protein
VISLLVSDFFLQRFPLIRWAAMMLADTLMFAFRWAGI